jgi:hypothetical protein
MAATAVYASVQPVLYAPRAGDGNIQLNISATSPSFQLSGGRYYAKVAGSSFGTVTLQALADDATTWLTAATAFSANGAVGLDLGPGTYRWALG